MKRNVYIAVFFGILALLANVFIAGMTFYALWVTFGPLVFTSIIIIPLILWALFYYYFYNIDQRR